MDEYYCVLRQEDNKMEKQILFSGEDIVTIRLALYEAERSLRARAELLDENYSEMAESAQKLAEECHALSDYIFDQIMGGESNG